LNEYPGSAQSLWTSAEANRLLRRQRPDGSFPYPGGGKEHLRETEDYDQLETYRVLGSLVDKYAATREFAPVEKAAGFLFSRQTEEGDFRGIYGRQYTLNYSAQSWSS